MTYQQLVTAFQAVKATVRVCGETEDGGQRNYDIPIFQMNHLLFEEIGGAACEAGLSAHLTNLGGFWYTLDGWCNGYGNRRTRQALAAAQALQEHGIPSAHVYYKFDAPAPLFSTPAADPNQCPSPVDNINRCTTR